jgi:hypothetical protein
VHEPVRLPQSSEGRPTSIALEAARDGFRAVVARSTPSDIVLDAVRVTSDGAAADDAFALVGLDAPASFETSLAMQGDALFFDDEGRALGERRLRRAVVGWRP